MTLTYNDISIYTELQEELERQGKKVFERLQEAIPRWYRDYFYTGIAKTTKDTVTIKAKHLISPETEVTVAIPSTAFVDSQMLEELAVKWKASMAM